LALGQCPAATVADSCGGADRQSACRSRSGCHCPGDGRRARFNFVVDARTPRGPLKSFPPPRSGSGSWREGGNKTCFDSRRSVSFKVPSGDFDPGRCPKPSVSEDQIQKGGALYSPPRLDPPYRQRAQARADGARARLPRPGCNAGPRRVPPPPEWGQAQADVQGSAQVAL